MVYVIVCGLSLWDSKDTVYMRQGIVETHVIAADITILDTDRRDYYGVLRHSDLTYGRYTR